MARQENLSKYSYYVAWSPEDREFAVSFIELPGLSGMGPTVPEAIEQLHEAFAGWLQVAKEKGFELPPAIQKDAPIPLVIVDRSHMGQEALVTDLMSILPKELRPSSVNIAETSSGKSSEVALSHAA